jgi:hypothetical protein
MNKQDYIKKAIEFYGSDDIEFDEASMISESDEGAFVQAWVWVSKEDLEEEDS